MNSLNPFVLLPSPESAVSAAAARLYSDAFVLDANALDEFSSSLLKANPEEFARLIRDSGVTVVRSTIGGAGGNFEEAVAAIARMDEVMEKHSNLLLKIRVVADLDLAQTEGKLGVIYAFESASMLEDKPARIELFRRLGVRVMQLSYNHSTALGAGCLDGETGGLSEAGREAIARMNETGVALDLSHSNIQTTNEALAASQKPPLITHAGCRAISMHPRNKEDAQMKALADKGGVMGIYMLPYLTASPRQPMLDDFMQHLEHALKICGEDHVGIGTDVPFFPVDQHDLDALAKEVDERKATGVSAPGEDRPTYIPDLNTARKMERIADRLLQRGYPATAGEKILGKNFKRAFEEIWTTT